MLSNALINLGEHIHKSILNITVRMIVSAGEIPLYPIVGITNGHLSKLAKLTTADNSLAIWVQHYAGLYMHKYVSEVLQFSKNRVTIDQKFLVMSNKN